MCGGGGGGGGMDTEKSQQRKLTLEKKSSRRSCQALNLWLFDQESGALTTEQSILPSQSRP